MWITRRTDYTTRAVLALTLAGADESLTLNDLAARTATPRSVVEQVMRQLRASGLVRSERGPTGGYRLNKDPGEISVERVVRAFQGQLAPIECATRHEPEHCPMEVGCTLQAMWRDVRDATIDILSRTTFADLAEQADGPWLDPSLVELARPSDT
ncbi:MAG: Rrf2 family transcriptional regulator [Acidimicrobiia bacterium]|nr:Rrf2 family transcriptional regulator [Acidimicrobiia bacterium]